MSPFLDHFALAAESTRFALSLWLVRSERNGLEEAKAGGSHVAVSREKLTRKAWRRDESKKLQLSPPPFSPASAPSSPELIHAPCSWPLGAWTRCWPTWWLPLAAWLLLFRFQKKKSSASREIRSLDEGRNEFKPLFCSTPCFSVRREERKGEERSRKSSRNELKC